MHSRLSYILVFPLLFPLAAKAGTAEQAFAQRPPATSVVRRVSISANGEGLQASGVAGAGSQIAVQSGDKIIVPAMERLRTFLDRFVDADKTASEQASFFTEDADYYEHGVVGKSAIVRDVTRYARHWPHRNYRVLGIDYINFDPDSDRVFVSYTIDFEVANRSRSITGTANYGALIGNLSVAPRIEAIKEIVTERKSSPALNR